MAFRPIVLPDPPPITGFTGVPEIFDKGVTTVVRSAIIIGNGKAGAEHQCIGLVKALGLGNSFQIQRIERPVGGFNELLRWLPLILHRKVNSVLYGGIWALSGQFVMSFLRRKSVEPKKLNSDLKINTSDHSAIDIQNPSSSALKSEAEQIADKANSEMASEGPLLVVASGRDTVETALQIKKLTPASTFLVQIQHPHRDCKDFDMVITPSHDYYGYTNQAKTEFSEYLLRFFRPQPPETNVVLTVGALHHADSVSLRSAAATWQTHMANLPRPLVVVNIGGPQRYCRYGHETVRNFVTSLKQMLVLNGGSVRISFSRRTPSRTMELITREFEEVEQVHVWDGRGPNPHLGHLAWADAFIVTADSVSMLSEACSTGKPVYAFASEHCSWKLKDFLGNLRKRGALRTFTGFENMAESWSYPPLRDNEEAAQKVREALALRGWSI